MGRLFGTDGVRGVANAEPLTPELAYRLGRATAAFLLERVEGGGGRPSILIGRDTRVSGQLLEQALTAGILSTGVDVLAGGVLPTPAVALLTSALGALGGVVLSASHNPFADNGIKLFSRGGDKLPDAWEDGIEAGLEGIDGAPRPTGAGVGRWRAVPTAERRYLGLLRRSVPADLRLDGRRIVLDCAHGATYRVAPRLLRALGAEVRTLGVRPTGTNINDGAGALHPGRLAGRVRALGSAVGLAFDGDGDRLIAVDEAGEVRDGDFLLAIFARDLAARGVLRGGTVVTTVMANYGLERALAAVGIGTTRVQVGDRHVLEEMRHRGANLGGEQSGHIILLDHAPTGDGLLAALQLLWIGQRSGEPLRDLARALTKFPQVLVNVPVRAKPALAGVPAVAETLGRWEAALAGRGRILLRYSGTEPLARVMAEGDDPMLIDKAVQEIASAIRATVGGPA